MLRVVLVLCILSAMAAACRQGDRPGGGDVSIADTLPDGRTPISSPLIEHVYTADPSAHVFDGKIYIYPSHDIDAGIPPNESGDHFAMNDYHVFSMDSVPGTVTDHGVALTLGDIPWAKRQLWAPDAAEANGQYYLFFPAKDGQDIFRIGVATSASPTGPFKAEPLFINNSYSIDPAVFEDADGSFYLYFGGIWGGQLEHWPENVHTPGSPGPEKDAAALGPRVARLSKDLKQFDEPVRELKIVDETGAPIRAADHSKRFFEAAWMHRYQGKYYLSYSTGDTHLICYATGDNPYGPFTYRGVILHPVIGWTNHHSIIEYKGKWYLFYHDSTLSGGKTHLRNIKVTGLEYNEDGTIRTIHPYRE